MSTHCRFLLAIAVLMACAGPSATWLYDGSDAQMLGVPVITNSNCKWAAAPFEVDFDCYATTIGAAASRAGGPRDAGFDVYITSTLSGLPGSAIAKLPQPLVPLNPGYNYYYGALDAPVLLTAGTVYALVFIPTSPDLSASLSFGAEPGSYYGQGTGDNGATWFELVFPLAVRVDGHAVPEPSSMAGILVSVLGWGMSRKRKKPVS